MVLMAMRIHWVLQISFAFKRLVLVPKFNVFLNLRERKIWGAPSVSFNWEFLLRQTTKNHNVIMIIKRVINLKNFYTIE